MAKADSNIPGLKHSIENFNVVKEEAVFSWSKWNKKINQIQALLNSIIRTQSAKTSTVCMTEFAHT